MLKRFNVLTQSSSLSVYCLTSPTNLLLVELHFAQFLDHFIEFVNVSHNLKLRYVSSVITILPVPE